MGSWMSAFPALARFFPPTPQAFSLISNVFRVIPALMFLVRLTPLKRLQAMGKTSSSAKSWMNLPGRYAWTTAELVGPLNLIFILYSLPTYLKPMPASSTSIFGTGLPIQQEIMGLLYVIHYINRAVVAPLYLAPSLSPIHLGVAVLMALFQYLNSSCIASWVTYSMAGQTDTNTSILSLMSVSGFLLFATGLAGNILSENKLFSLRRAAAKRKARSEGKPVISYDKVYVIPPAEGLFRSSLFPHYFWEWVEWTGYWILGGAWGFGYGYSSSAALWFLINELVTMSPRAYDGKQWYEQKFGKRAVGGRAAVIPRIL